MQEFEIRLRSVQDVQEFVALATSQTFPILVGNKDHQVNGKSFMEMFCLDFTKPMYATAQCGEGDLAAFREAIERFLAK